MVFIVGLARIGFAIRENITLGRAATCKVVQWLTGLLGRPQ